MAVTYGFYNSLNKDRMYNAEQMSSIFNGIITDGVFSTVGDALMTVAGSGMQVVVKTGRAWFNSTWTLNDALLPLDIPTADVSLTRIDAVILEVNSAIATRANSIKILKGTASANPAKPTLSDAETLHQYALAYVTVAAGATSITAANIEVNVGKTGCPFITSVLQQTDITDLFNQWEAEFDTWFSNVQSQLSGDVAANLQRQIDENKNKIEDIENLTNSHLSAATKTLMGLPSSAEPDDAFQYLFAFAQAIIPSGYGIFLGKVVDQNGKPVSGAIIYIYSASPVALKYTLTSDANGMIQTNLEPGSYTCLMDDAPNFFTYNAVSFTMTEKRITSVTINMNIAYSSKIFITNTQDIVIPAWIDKYDIFAVGGGGGGATGYYVRNNNVGTIVAMCGGAGGFTKTVLAASAKKLRITIGDGGKGGIVTSTAARQPTSGSKGGTTSVLDITSNTSGVVICQAAGGEGGNGSYNTPGANVQASGGSASGAAYYIWEEDREDGYSGELEYAHCSNGRTDGASVMPLSTSEIVHGSWYLSSLATGQGSTTREFGESDGALYASGAGAACRLGSYGTKISSSGEGAGQSSFSSYTTSQVNQPCDATQYGCGGGCTYSGQTVNQRGGNGKQGVVIIRWNAA